MARKHSGKSSAPATTGTVVLPAALTNNLRMADMLIRSRRYEEALTLLQRLKQQYPRQPEVLIDLAFTLQKMGRMEEFEAISMDLIALKPNEPDFYLPLVGAHVHNARITLAYQRVEQFLQRWPQHAEAKDARRQFEVLQKALPGLYEEVNLVWPDDIEVGMWHDQMQILLQTGKYAEVRRLGEQLLTRKPHFAPALNNISQSYFVEGDYAKAISYTERVLDFDAENVHSLANLARYSLFLGRRKEAEEFGARLKASKSEAFAREFKVVQALTFLGDDAGVLETYRKAVQTGSQEKASPTGRVGQSTSEESDQIEQLPMLHHLAAVAYLRSGDEPAARACWRRALALKPDLAIASENLRDLTRPVGERNAPWPFAVNEWCAPALLTALRDALAQSKDVTQDSTSLQTFLREHPEFMTAVPLLLEHGDSSSRALALAMARTLPSDTRASILSDFVTSPHGPDSLRVETVNLLIREGLLPDKPVRMWIGGEWRDTLPLDYEIDYELPAGLSTDVQHRLVEAHAASEAEDYDTATHIYEELVAQDPDNPALLVNLAGAYSEQGREDEYRALIEQIRTQHPDDLLGQINAAHLHIRAGELDAADAILKPLVTRKRFHISEFSAFAGAQILLSIQTREFEQAQKWLEMWEMVDPDHDNLPVLRERLLVARSPTVLPASMFASPTAKPTSPRKPTFGGLSKLRKSKLTGKEE